MIKMERKTASGIMLTLLIGSMLFSAISLVKGQTNTHDLEVSLSTFSPLIINGTYNHLSSGNSTVINATVVNRGDFNESNVGLQLLINDTVVLNAMTPILEVNHTFWTAYFWNPTDADYYLTVYAPPVSGEDNVTNNVVTKWVRVCQDQPPTTNFTYSPPPPLPGPIRNGTVSFDASSSFDPDWGIILNYTWNFGDGNITTVSYFNITHKYTTWGNRTVTLTLRDTENLTASMSKNITVYARPTASFGIDKPRPLPGPYYVNETLTFNAKNSSDPDNMTAPNKGIMNYTWMFGDGNITSTPEPLINHTYAIEADYFVFLNVTDFDGLTSDQIFVPLNVGSGRPVADFVPPQGQCLVYYPLFFDASASYDPDNMTAPNRGIATYTWNFDDGNTTTVTSSNITHTYQNPGIYNVNLTVADYEGVTSSINKTVPVTFEVFVKAVDSANGTMDIVYNPGDDFNLNITVTNVVDLFSYEVNLTWLGAKYPILAVKNVQSAGFLAPEDFEAHFSSYQGFVLIKSLRVGVVNGVNGNGTLATVTFHVNDTMTGSCSLQISYSLLKNSTGGNITATLIDGRLYTTKPVANFTCSQYAVANMTAVFFDASASYDPDNMTAPNRGIATYTWNFDDGNVTSMTSPTITHLYESAGSYNVNLTVTDYASETWSMNYTVMVVTGRDVAIVKIELGTLHFNTTTGLYETAGQLPINVTVINEGNSVSETFNVTIYFGSTSIETKLVTNLMPGKNTTVRFGCDIDGIAKGIYNISAYAWPLLGETHTSDNNYTDGAVRVYLKGDIDRNNSTDIYDAIMLANAIYSKPGDPNWNLNADLNDDGVVDIYDAIIIANNYDKKDP